MGHRGKPHSRKSLGLLALASTLAVSAMGAQAGEGDIVAFRTKAQVSIDAQGHPTSVVVPKELPAPVARFVEQQVMQWRFEAPVIDGQPRGGQTWVALGACAAPVAGGYQLAIDYKGVGPMSTTADGIYLPPAYPQAAARQGMDFAGDVKFVVDTDGRATYESVDVIENKAGKPGLRQFEPALRDWVRQMRFDPEYIDGKAVKTRMSVHVDFKVMDKGEKMPVQAPSTDKPECRTAMKQGDAMRPMALDSPFKRIDTGG